MNEGRTSPDGAIGRHPLQLDDERGGGSGEGGVGQLRQRHGESLPLFTLRP